MTNQQLEVLRQLYPLLQLDYEEQYDQLVARSEPGGVLRLAKEPHSNRSLVLVPPTVVLNSEHAQLAIAKRLMELYPHLYLQALMNKEGITVQAWVKRDGKDAEAMGVELPIDGPEFHQQLSAADEEAEAACAVLRGGTERFFFCEGHRRSEPEAWYEYRYFAGRYCTVWGDAHPDHRETALRETYE